MEKDTNDNAHDEALQGFVGGEEEEVAEGSEGCHDGKECEEPEGAPEAVAVGDEKADEDEGDGDVVEDDAIEEALVDVAVEVDEGHAFEKGVDAEADDETGHGMGCPVVAVALVGEMGVVVLMGFVFLFAAGAVVVAMLGAASELLEKELDEEANHDGGGYFEVKVGGDEAVGVVAEEDVRDEVDEAGCKQESTTEDGDGGGEFGADLAAAGYERDPGNDAYNDEDVGEY